MKQDGFVLLCVLFEVCKGFEAALGSRGGWCFSCWVLRALRAFG